MSRPVSMTRRIATTSYDDWMASEGIPVARDECGIEDVAQVERKPWARLGGKGAFIHMRGQQEAGFNGMYVVEIPPHGALEPERHMYEEIMYVVRGQGTAEFWHDEHSKRTLEWGESSLFAPPLNTWHRLYNLSAEPAILLAVTTAPIVIDLFHNTRFVFDNSFEFEDRFDGRGDFFTVGKIVERDPGAFAVWDTNFIPDLRHAFVDERENRKGYRVQIMGFEMADNVFTGHISQWPAGIYHKAHFHGPGAILLGLNSSGYVLLWPKEIGITPYQDGLGDQVRKVRWGPGAVYSPPDGWFHQHFNTGAEKARHIAFRTGGSKYRMGLHSNLQDPVVNIKEGGALIEYEDEDPQVRRDFEAALKSAGVACEMPAFVG